MEAYQAVVVPANRRNCRTELGRHISAFEFAMPVAGGIVSVCLSTTLRSRRRPGDRGANVTPKFVQHVILAIGLLLPMAVPAIAATLDPVEQKVTAIRNRFVAAVHACGVTPKFEPAVRILSEPAVIAYRGKTQTLVIGRWETLPPPIKGFLNQWAAYDMPGKSGEALFDQLFNGFLVGHELGHWVGDQSGRLDTIDFYEAEIEANQFAIAFAALDPATARLRATTVGQFSYLRALPDPVPPGQDVRAYFNAHYWTMSTQDPVAYNWYQGRFMQEAWDRRDQATFCKLVKSPPEPNGRAPGR